MLRGALLRNVPQHEGREGMLTSAFLQIIRPVPIRDLAAGRDPYARSRLDMRQRLVEVSGAVRHADQERVQAYRHAAAGLGAVLVENVELITDHLRELLAAAVMTKHG